jgi:hypothetical protein
VQYVLPSAKCRALGKAPLCRVSSAALGKESFAECQTLGKQRHSVKLLFAECSANKNTRQRAYPGHSCPMPTPFVECPPLGTRQTFFKFWPPNFFFRAPTVFDTPCWSLIHFSACLLYFFNFFHWIEFFWISQIWTVSHLNNGKNVWKNNIHVIESNVRPYPGTCHKFGTYCSWNMTTNLRANCF